MTEAAPARVPLRLTVTGLTVSYPAGAHMRTKVVSDVELTLAAGRIVGLVGESGSGKSTTGLALIGAFPSGALREAGRAQLGDIDLYGIPSGRLQGLWGKRLAYVAQGAGSSLNPVRTVGAMLTEAIRLHLGHSRRAAAAEAASRLRQVGIPSPEAALRRFPHQFSGGQQQRVALALALACGPEVLVLDEPTSGLDASTQREINQLIARLVIEREVAALYITHDIAAIVEICDQLVVMYGGEVVESGPGRTVAARPRHPYTADLRDAVPVVNEPHLPAGIPGRPPPAVVEDACAYAPRCRYAIPACQTTHPPLLSTGDDHLVRCIRSSDLGQLASIRSRLARSVAMEGDEVLQVENLTCKYGASQPEVVSSVSLSLQRGETLAVVGESGSGKSTLLKAIAGLLRPSAGRISLGGSSLAARASERSREARRSIQIVFQNPETSLNPRHSVERLLSRPMELFRPDIPRSGYMEAILASLVEVRLDAAVIGRRPHELSGGQKQRVALARAFIANPSVMLCDEVVSALDVSVAASILELLAGLASSRGTSVIFVTHNLAIVRAIADTVAVMRSGEVVEYGTAESVVGSPSHPYTRSLLAAVANTAVLAS